MEIMHLDKIRELAQRASVAHGAVEGELDYERFGVCTPDLSFTAMEYAKEALTEIKLGASIASAMTMLFLAGFDIGYQARLEIESQSMASDKALDPEGDVQ